jgi:hypothetical protein
MLDKRSPSGRVIGVTGAVVLTYGAIAAGAVQTQTGSCPGARPGDLVLVNFTVNPTWTLGIGQAFVPAANQISVTICNIGLAPIAEGAVTFGYELRRAATPFHDKRAPSGKMQGQTWIKTLTFANCAPNGTKSSLRNDFYGIVPGDLVRITPLNALDAGMMILVCFVYANNGVQTVVGNYSAGAINLGSREYRFEIRHVA